MSESAWNCCSYSECRDWPPDYIEHVASVFYDPAEGMALGYILRSSFAWFLVFGTIADVTARVLNTLLAVSVAYVFSGLGHRPC